MNQYYDHNCCTKVHFMDCLSHLCIIIFIVLNASYRTSSKRGALLTSVQACAVLMPLAMFLLLLKSSFYNEFYIKVSVSI